MPSVCLSLNIHQSFVLRHFSVFEVDEQYFDSYRSRELALKLAMESVLPTNRILLCLLRRFEGRFRFACCLSGATIDLFERYCPDVLDSFRELHETGGVEFLATTYHHGLPFLYSATAFEEEVGTHRRRIEELVGQQPTAFCNKSLIYGDSLADPLARMGMRVALCDGSCDTLEGRSCGHVYAAGSAPLRLLMRNEQLSCDVAERFADRGWEYWPLTAPRFAEWIAGRSGDEVVSLVWDYATFGRRHPADTGVFDFLRYLPEKVLDHEGVDFLTPSEAAQRYEPVGAYRPRRFVSTRERREDLSAWIGNPMQSHAMHRLYELEPAIRRSGDQVLLNDWRCLQCGEYFRAMDTDAETAAPACAGRIESPYDAYINFMNICDSVASRIEGHGGPAPPPANWPVPTAAHLSGAGQQSAVSD
jgi:alpha-amylase